MLLEIDDYRLFHAVHTNEVIGVLGHPEYLAVGPNGYLKYYIYVYPRANASNLWFAELHFRNGSLKSVGYNEISQLDTNGYRVVKKQFGK